MLSCTEYGEEMQMTFWVLTPQLYEKECLLTDLVQY